MTFCKCYYILPLGLSPIWFENIFLQMCLVSDNFVIKENPHKIRDIFNVLWKLSFVTKIVWNKKNATFEINKLKWTNK